MRNRTDRKSTQFLDHIDINVEDIRPSQAGEDLEIGRRGLYPDNGGVLFQGARQRSS